jgi:integrase
VQLWKHPNGTWYVRFGKRLKQRVSSRTKDRKEAEVFFSQFVAAESGLTPDDPNMGAILEAYQADRTPCVRSKKTLEGSVKVLQRHFKDLKPKHLNPAVIRKFAVERKAADGTILRDIGTLRAALAWAVEHQWIANKPIISNPVKIPPPRDRWITKDEARKLITSCVEHHVKLFIIVGLNTAARMGAILEAKWDQVDWDRKVIDFGAGHGNKRRALVPLNSELERALLAARQLACSDYIIEWHGERVGTIKNGFKMACERAGLKDVSPHVLRHSAATWLAIDGVPLREIARLLGDQEATVERVYAKHSPDYLRRATSAVQLGLEAAQAPFS